MAGDAWRPNTPQEIALRGCLGKVRYSSAEFARHVRRQCEVKRNTALRIYHCTVCDRWHLAKHIAGQPLCGTCLQPFSPRDKASWQCEGCEK